MGTAVQLLYMYNNITVDLHSTQLRCAACIHPMHSCSMLDTAYACHPWMTHAAEDTDGMTRTNHHVSFTICHNVSHGNRLMHYLGFAASKLKAEQHCL
jgi:hypothetical protein